MLKKLALFILILIIPLIISADQLSESESFLAAKAAYDDSSFADALDLFNKFINNFPLSPAVPEAKLYQAQCFFRQDRFIEARDTLNNLEKSYVPFAIEDKFLFLSGQVYLKAKDFKEAARYFKKLTQRHPESGLLEESKMQLGGVLFQDAKYDQAQKVFDSLTKSENLAIQEEALFRKGEALFFNKDYRNCLDSYNAFLKLFPKSERLARAYFYMAEASFYLEDLPNATGYYCKGIQLAKDDAATNLVCLQGLGWSYLKQNKLSQAEEAFLKAEKLQGSEFNKENFLLGMATLYYQWSKFDKSIVYYEELINNYPHTEVGSQALLGKAQCLTRLSRLDEAIPLYDKIIEEAQNDPREQAKDLIDKSYYNLGCIYFSRGDFKPALAKFQKVSLLCNNKELKYSAFTYLADTYQRLNNFDKAIEVYLRLLKDYPDSPQNDYALYQIGISQLKTEDIPGAIESFKNFNREFNNSPYLDGVNYYLCYAYFEGGDYTGACEQLQKFLQAFSGSPYTDKAVYLLANSFYNRKMYKQAMDNFERIFREFPENQVLAQKAEYAIIYALYEQGEETRAIKQIRQFIDNHPDSPLTQNLLFWLGQYYYQNSLYGLSRGAFAEIISHYPHNKGLVDEAQYEIGLSYLAENNIDEALNIFRKLQDKVDNSLITIKATLALADLLSQENNFQEAVGMYEKAIRLASIGVSPKDKSTIESAPLLDYTVKESQLPQLIAVSKEGDSLVNIIKIAYIRLGDLYKQDKGLDKAINAYRQAIKYSEKESSAYLQFKIGECYEEKNDFNAAIQEYLNIPRLCEKDTFWVVKGLLCSANIYEQSEDWPKAMSMYERVLNYDTQEAKYAKERIGFIKSVQ